MLVPVPTVLFGMGLLMALISVPLVLRKIPMNHTYGIRVRKAFVSQENWYAINVYGGKLFIGFGIWLMVFSALTSHIAPLPTSPWAPVYLVIPLLAILPILVLIKSFGKGLPDR